MLLDPAIVREQDTIAAWRRDFHRYPELGFEEHRTSGRVAELLRGWGIDVHEGVGRTGVVGALRGHSDQRALSIGLRADMDALSIQEISGRPHGSEYRGVMHACGHDGHTAMLLGATRRLAQTRDFDGTVNFIFQPAEEGLGGAKAMVNDGLFERFPCQTVWGLHNWPELPLGKIGIRAGSIMAAQDLFEIQVKGEGGHGALPHLSVDPIVTGAAVVTALQSIVSRETDPLGSAVISVTAFQGGSTFNAIPASVELLGTLRSLTLEGQQLLRDRVERVVTGVAAGFGVDARITFKPNAYPPTINSPAEVEKALQAAKAVVGDTNVLTNLPPSMGSEDFAFMLLERPGCYIWLGQGTPGGCMVHSEGYDFNDQVSPIGVSYWISLVRQLLQVSNQREK